MSQRAIGIPHELQKPTLPSSGAEPCHLTAATPTALLREGSIPAETRGMAATAQTDLEQSPSPNPGKLKLLVHLPKQEEWDMAFFESCPTVPVQQSFPTIYKKHVPKQFNIAEEEFLPTSEEHRAQNIPVPEQQQTYIADDNFMRITASQGIPVLSQVSSTLGTATTDASASRMPGPRLWFPEQPEQKPGSSSCSQSFPFSKGFIRQLFLQLKDCALEFYPHLGPHFPQLFLSAQGSHSLPASPVHTSYMYMPKLPGGSSAASAVVSPGCARNELYLPMPQIGVRGMLEMPVTLGSEGAASWQNAQQLTPLYRHIPTDSFSGTDWADIRKKALREKNFHIAESIALPGSYGPQDGNPRWERLDYEVVKDLMKAVKENGLGSPYFKRLLKCTFNTYDLTPYDCRSIASMILTDSQLLIWDAKWRRALGELRNKYQGGPNAALTIPQLAGDPSSDRPENQARDLPRYVLADIKEAARKAILQIPPAGTPESIYTEIKQGPSEPFTSFLDRLTQAMDRQVSEEAAKPHLLRSLAFANANVECKGIISAMPGQPTVTEMVEACSKVGTPQYVATIQASIWGEQLKKILKAQNETFLKTLTELQLACQQNSSTEVMAREFVGGPCYKCGKHGHVKKNCPESAKTVKSPDLCPRCRRGKHHASQCHSKTNVDGRPLPLPGNSNKSASL
uniref:CCHC-type domain-containing protein n=1 Tax=Cyanoderma ruficeps TaxID=181631 RepID=A0A8C3QKU9_9PASS